MSLKKEEIDISNHPIQLILEENDYKTIVKDAWSGREIENVTECKIDYDPCNSPTIYLTIKPRESVFCVK